MDHNASIDITRDQLDRSFAVYLVSRPENGELIFCGICRAREVFAMPDALRNSEFLRMTNGSTPLRVKIIATYDQKHDAYNHRYRIIQQHQPPANARGIDLSKTAVIVCNETGQRYPSIVDCCQQLGLSQPQLSNHLNRRPGYNSVKGRTFSRVIPEQPYAPPSQPTAPTTPTYPHLIHHPTPPMTQPFIPPVSSNNIQMGPPPEHLRHIPTNVQPPIPPEFAAAIKRETPPMPPIPSGIPSSPQTVTRAEQFVRDED